MAHTACQKASIPLFPAGGHDNEIDLKFPGRVVSKMMPLRVYGVMAIFIGLAFSLLMYHGKPVENRDTMIGNLLIL